MDLLLKLKISNYFYFLLIIICEISTSEIPRPRGVSISRATLYNPDKDFTCFDGSLTIPFNQVNDDYCDCPDASDEPGTSACPHGIFHCTNAGHKPLNIAASRVNDGVCDCCDATDEFANKNAHCVNNCRDLGRTAREDALKKAELIKAGKQIRAELSEKAEQLKEVHKTNGEGWTLEHNIANEVQVDLSKYQHRLLKQGVQLKQEMKEKLTEYQKNKVEAEKLQSEKEAIKKQMEELENAALQHYREIEEEENRKRTEAEAASSRVEATETFNKFDSNRDGKVDISELQTRSTFDRDRNGEVSEEEATYFLMDKDSLELEEFVTDAWSRIKPFLMMDAGLFKPPPSEPEEHHEENLDEPQDEDIPEGDEMEEEQETEGDEEQEEYQEEKPEEEAATPAPPKYDEETQRLIDQASAARDEFSSADKAVRDIQAEITKIEDYLGKDFGPDEEFASLQGQCFEYTDYEYIYRLCPFDKVTQQQKSGAGDTRLGTWSNWVGIAEDRYNIMLYDRGQSCWNGPQRSARVTVSCGSENKITSVSEPNRCEYHFDFTTPAACRESPEDYTDDVHDEL